MASPAASTAMLDLLDPRDFPDRDSLINFLSTQCGWPTAKLGQLFNLSTRQARRIACDRPPWRPAEREDGPAPLTQGEAECMLRDLACDPYTSPAERELAMTWVTDHARISGIAELRQVPGRKFARPQPKPRNSYGRRQPAGQV